jgi:hypothetical protein
MPDTLLIPRRFNGPPASGNGGYVAGLLAIALRAQRGPAPAVEVTLRAPPPLDTALALRGDATEPLGLWHDERLLAEARAVALSLAVPEPPDAQAAAAAGALGRLRAAGRIGNSYLSCFGCGVSREPHDGLRIVPSPVGDAGVVASDWTPHAALADDGGCVPEPVVWAALDCPAGIAWNYRLVDAPPLVTGRMTVAVDAPVPVGEPLRVIGWPIEAEGRKLHAGSALFDATGRVLARSRQVWMLPRA